MKEFLRTLARGAVFGLGLALAIGTVSTGYSAIPFFTGPTGSNPTDLPIGLGGINALINSINNELTSYLNLGNPNEVGELAFSATSSFNAVGATSGLVNNLPSGAQSTPKQYLLIIDETGRVGYVPVF